MWIMMDYFIDFAAYEPTSRYISGAGNIPLERGQWAFTERELSEFFGVDRQRIRTCLKKLKTKPFINPTSNPKYTLVKVINYDTYQSDDCKPNPEIPHQLTSSKPTPNPKPVSTIRKELKNIRREEVTTVSTIPENFILTPGLKAFAVKKNIPEHQIENWFDAFVNKYKANGEQRKDWASAWFAYISAVAANPKNSKQPTAQDQRKSGVQRTMEIFARREYERQQEEKANRRDTTETDKLLSGRDDA
jgi:hypothetical protein